MAQYCIIQFLGMGTILILTYKFAGDYEDGLTMFAWSYGNLSTDNIARLVPVAGCWWTVGLPFCYHWCNSFNDIAIWEPIGTKIWIIDKFMGLGSRL